MSDEREVVPQRAIRQHVVGILAVVLVAAGVAFWQASMRATELADEEAEEVVRATALALALPLTGADLAVDGGWVVGLDAAVSPLIDSGAVVTVHLWRRVDEQRGEIAWSSSPDRTGDVVALGGVGVALDTGKAVIERLHDGGESEGPSVPNLYEIYQPFEDRTGASYVLEVYRPVQEYDEIRAGLLRDWLPLALLGIVATGIVTLPLSVRLARSVGRAHRDRQEFADQALRARAEEHRRIAEVLHEGTVQDLAAARLILESARSQPGSAELSEALDRTTSILAADLLELRELLTTGEATEWQAEHLLDALAGWVDHLMSTSDSGDPASAPAIDITGVDPDLRLAEPAVGLAFRIVKECVRNALKHARPERIDVRVEQDEDSVRLWVSDDGAGIASSATGGIGLRIIRQSVAAVQGEVGVEAGARGGTVVRARLPRVPVAH